MKLENRTNKAIILEMMPKICELRSLGYRMPSIYKAFKGEGLITCSLDHFRANYYAFKREMNRSQPVAPVAALVPKTVVQTASTSVPKMTAQIAPKVLSETVARVPTTVEATDELMERRHECENSRYETGKSEKNPERTEPENNEPVKAASKGGPISGFDLERNVSLATIHFEKNRNRNRRR